MIYGILGSQASMSRSPDMHNAFFREHALDAVYVSFQHECLGTFMEDAQSFGVRGVSVTNPFKEEVFKILYEQDAVSNDAIAIGAVNTMVMMDGQWKGFNTDVDGVKNPLRRVEGRRGMQVIVLGAGGAARAAVTALNELGMQTTVLSRRREQGAALARVLGCEAGILEDLGRLEFDILINATPVGSYMQPGLVVEISALSMSGKIVFDMVTVPEETELIRKAKAAGATTISGLEMLSEQAVGQARLWTGIAGNVDTFRSAARRVRT